jgi:hypothetical protein
MEWIEQLLHFSPDGGSGATEALYAAVVGIGFSLVGVVLLARRRRGSSVSKTDSGDGEA